MNQKRPTEARSVEWRNKNRKMGLFNFRKNYFIGIDFGTSAIKVVELSYRGQKIYLENYGWVETGLSSGGENVAGAVKSTFDQKILFYVQELFKKMELKGKNAFISIPGYSGLITFIEFPEMSKEDLEKAIQFEAHKHVPTSLEDVALSWDVVGKKKDEQGVEKIQVILVAASKKEISKYEGLVQKNNFTVEVIELETFSLVRSLVGDDPSTFLIIDIGARATNIVLVEKGVIRSTRNIDVGGYDITNTVADSLNIAKARAEILKKEKNDLLGGNDLSLVIPTLELITNESLRIINSFKVRSSGALIDGVIISGGSGKLKGLGEYFTKSLGVKAMVGNPWRKIVVEEKLAKTVTESLGSSFSVAVGLALRGVENYQRN